MVAKKARDAKVQAFLDKAQAREDRYRAQRLSKIKRAIAGAEFMDGELSMLEEIVFLAFGRTKLQR
jgi:hypothetical protein